jgi:hypothetical protein
MSHSGQTKESSLFGVAYEKKTGQSFLPAAPNKFFSNMTWNPGKRESPCPPSFALSFLKSKLCGPEQGRCRKKQGVRIEGDFFFRLPLRDIPLRMTSPLFPGRL